MIKPKKGILVIGILLVVTISAILVYNPINPGKQKPGIYSNKPIPEIRVKTFQKENHWGYTIYIDTTLFIYQEYLPGLPGQQLFTTEKQANDCGVLVRDKMLKRKIPSISTKELDSLGITYNIQQ
jgi:hypothetical protein